MGFIMDGLDAETYDRTYADNQLVARIIGYFRPQLTIMLFVAVLVVLNSLMEICRAGGALGIPGLYVTEDPGAADKNARTGNLSIRIGLGWAKSHVLTTGQCPVMKYNRQLMMAILHDKIKIAKAVNVTVVNLEEAVQGYKDFDKGAAKKFVLDPHGAIAA